MCEKKDYTKSVNLPSTEFPMRGNLPQREPEILKQWQELDIYNRLNEKNKGKTPFILHDGPPYANGDLHMGTGNSAALLFLGFNPHTGDGQTVHLSKKIFFLRQKFKEGRH